MNSRYSVKEISTYIIKYCDEHFGGVSNLRLQKLLYFVQVAFIKTFNEAAFKEEIEPWGFGPVVPKIYREYRVFGRENIIIDRENNPRLPFWIEEVTDTSISKDDAQIINQVLEEAKDIPTAELVRISTVQEPWKKAYKRDSKEPCVITKESIRKYFCG